MSESSIPVEEGGPLLRTVKQTTVAGEVHSEAVVLVSPSNPDNVAEVTTDTPAADAPGVVVRLAGSIPVTIASAIEITNDAGNPIPVSAASLPLPVGAATAANQQTDALTNAQLRAAPVDVDTGLAQGIQDGGNVVVASSALPAGAATAANQALELAQLQAMNSLVPAVYDYIALSYTGNDLTGVVYKTGGSGGSTVSTLTLAYTGGVLQSVTRT